MKYLLSTGLTTNNKLDYVKDLIRLHLLIRINEIPYWDGGSNELIPSIIESEIESNINSIINSIITLITSKFTDISMSLDSITISGTKVTITLTINNITENYVILRRY